MRERLTLKCLHPLSLALASVSFMPGYVRYSINATTTTTTTTLALESWRARETNIVYA